METTAKYSTTVESRKCFVALRESEEQVNIGKFIYFLTGILVTLLSFRLHIQVHSSLSQEYLIRKSIFIDGSFM